MGIYRLYKKKVCEYLTDNSDKMIEGWYGFKMKVVMQI
jgi:hypothetical protein